MSALPKVLFVGESLDRDGGCLAVCKESVEAHCAATPVEALNRLAHEKFDGVYVAGEHLRASLELGKLLENERILQDMPDALALLDRENVVLWANARLREWSRRDTVVGSNFYVVLGSPEILGPDFCPFHSALTSASVSCSTLRTADNRFFRVHAAPVFETPRAPGAPAALPQRLIVTARDVTSEVLQQQKLAAIHRAGVELANLTPDALLHMSVSERIELLKSNILHYTQDVLQYDVVEIRLLDTKTGKLEPLLSVGLLPEATQRDLYAQPLGNGVTGFVAATGKSYLCEDTTKDPLYITGAQDAKSSLTVPLVLLDDVIGTFNVESPEPRAFSESDLQFLEIFTRDVAVALNTLELLVAEKASTTQESVEAIHSAVALPVDDILNDAVNVMERYIGHSPEVAERLQRILRNARDIKQVIQTVGQKMTPTQAHPQALQAPDRPLLKGRQILVVDADDSVRSAAHSLLDRYGCVVETAHDGNESLCMVRSLMLGAPYDVIIADIRLPDMTGYDLMLKLNELLDHAPLILMTGYGYDPSHSMANARRAGHSPQWVLYKPFRLDQLLNTVELVIKAPKPVAPSGS